MEHLQSEEPFSSDPYFSVNRMNTKIDKKVSILNLNFVSILSSMISAFDFIIKTSSRHLNFSVSEQII